MAAHWTSRSLRLFNGAPQVESFRDMAAIRPCRLVRRSASPLPLSRGEPVDLPTSYDFQGRRCTPETFLADTETVGLMAVKDGRVRFERYWLAQDATMTWTSFSVVKSMVSALVGIALREGLIDGIGRDLTHYLPELKGSAFDGVSIKTVLEMSSGMRWNENYGDPDAEITRYGQAMDGGSLDRIAVQSVREYAPDTHFRYNSMETHVLGMLLVRVARRSLSDLLREKLWDPCGMEDDAFFSVDGTGMEGAAGGLCATLRDYAKFGQLFLEMGARGGRQIVPAAWVHESTRPNAPHTQPGALFPGYPFGYGYQWWLPDGSGAYSAIGIYNQFIYVDPARRVVIAKNSANRNYARSYDEAGYRELEHMALFRAIADALA
jgi:CubicO group peptidase (beta-lactamase class C family)